MLGVNVLLVLYINSHLSCTRSMFSLLLLKFKSVLVLGYIVILKSSLICSCGQDQDPRI